MKNAVIYNLIKFSISCCIFFAPFLSVAQTRGKLEVVKDPLIDSFIARRPNLNKTIPAAEETTNGFRVQIFFGSNRQTAYNVQEKFKQEYPELRTYIMYTEPNFKVHAGDFRTRLEAEKLQKEINGMFTSMFIIPEKINPPKADASND